MSLRALAIIPLLLTNAAIAATRYEFHEENILGTSLELHIQATTAQQADQAKDELLRAVDRFTSIVSTWSSESELSKAIGRAGQFTPASPELFGFLQSCETWQHLSKGAFEPRVAELALIWKAAEKAQAAPTVESLQQAVHAIGKPAWTLNTETKSVRFEPGARVTFDAIAKGWIIDQAGQSVMSRHAELDGLMVNIGGDLRLWGTLAEQVAIADPKSDAENANPLATTRLHQQALATSGGYRRGWTIANQHYSHLLDPRTGKPANEVISASAVAPDAATADVLATIFSVLPVQESLQLAAALPNVHCLLVNNAGQVVRSPGWSDAVKPGPMLADAAAGSISTDPVRTPEATPGMEMLVDFELSNPEGRKYHRPYVAIWIEDKDEFPLRTLILWIQQGKDGGKYLRDLKRWDRNDRVRRTIDPISLIQTISSATRKSGQYRAVWDGKDKQGTLVKPGNYTLCIEAAREKGTYQLIRHPFVWGTEAYLDLLSGNVEISSAALECKPKSATP